MGTNYQKTANGINIIPSTPANSTTGDMAVSLTTGKLEYHNGTSSVVVPTISSTDPLTNKTIDASSNTITNVTNIKGTTTNDSASAGFVGEYVESVVGPINLAGTGTYKDLTSVTLTGGDWDVTLIGQSNNNGAVGSSYYHFGISAASGTSTVGLVFGSSEVQTPGSTAAQDCCGTVSGYRVSLTGTTIIYAKLSGAFSSGTPQAYGRLSARRVR